MNLRTLIRRITGTELELTEAQLEHRKLLARLAAVEKDRDTYQKHSVLANQLAWKTAVAVGDVPEGTDRIEAGNPLEQLTRLIDERDRLSARFAECDQQNEQATLAAAGASRDRADAATYGWLAGHHEDTIGAVAGLLASMRGRAAKEALDRIQRDADHARKFLEERRAANEVTPDGEPDHD